MKSKFLLSSLLLLSLLISACSSPKQDLSKLELWFEETEKIRVLCTIEMIEDLVVEVGGDKIHSLTLIQGQLDPHTYALVKGDDEKLAHAQLIFSNGLGLEHAPSLLNYLTNSKKNTFLGEEIANKSPSSILYHSGVADPHIWTDISLWKLCIPYIVEQLSAQAPEHRDYFVAKAATLEEKLNQVDQEIYSKLQAIPAEKRHLVTSHDAFNYFTRRYLREPSEVKFTQWQHRCEAPEGLAPDSQLSTFDIIRLVDHLEKFQIHVLFTESNISQDSIYKIQDAAKKRGIKVRTAKRYLYADAMGGPGSPGETYVKMIQHNADVIADNLMEEAF